MAAKIVLALACILTFSAGCSGTESTSDVVDHSTMNHQMQTQVGANTTIAPILISGTISSVGSCSDPVPSITPAPQLQDVQPVPMEAWNRTFSGPTSDSPGATNLCVAWLDAGGVLMSYGGATVPPRSYSALVRAAAAVQATYTITVM